MCFVANKALSNIDLGDNFPEYHQSVEQFGYGSGPTFFVGPDLGLNCLQKLSADSCLTGHG